MLQGVELLYFCRVNTAVECSSMLPIHQIDNLLKFCSQDHKDIVYELRNLVAEIAPTATEVVHSRGLTYFHAARGGPVSAGICQIGLYSDHIRLSFNLGVFLKDPNRLLEGKDTRLAKRYIRIDSYDQAPWDALKGLMIESSQFDPYSLKQA